ncbi:MAG: alkaline phosphatase D family protein, partial [Actinomycetota bacterium]
MAVAPFLAGSCGGSSGESSPRQEGALTAPSSPAVDARASPLPGDPFSLGVASGDPRDDSVVLWTRLAPIPAEPLGGLADAEAVPVSWEVGSNPDLTTLVAHGTESALAQHAHSLRVVADGLEPGTDYWYRFNTSGHASPTGHFRTLPEGADTFRVAVATCQAFYSGHYAAHRDLAETDVDLVVWLGDFIYEWSLPGITGREHNRGECRTLDDYRERYAQYRGDPHLQAASEAHAWIVLIDDHEIVNDIAGSTLEGNERRRALAALTAWWEHQPTRLPRPTSERLLDPMYQAVVVGDLARISTLDTRTNRTALPCGTDITEQCDAALTTGGLLGDAQREWLDETLAGPDVTWDLIAQQVMLSGFDISDGVISSTAAGGRRRSRGSARTSLT